MLQTSAVSEKIKNMGEFELKVTPVEWYKCPLCLNVHETREDAERYLRYSEPAI